MVTTQRAVAEAFEEMRRLKTLYCTGCRYCMPCPHGVNVPHCLESMSYEVIYGNRDYARFQYSLIGDPWHESSPASACTQCGECVPKCPRGIQIPERLDETDRVLG